jgi:excisionase family DNA binding protein
VTSKNKTTTSSEPLGNFSINSAAKYLSVHRSTVERLLHRGELGKDWWRIGRKIIIPKTNIFDFEKREREKRLTG